MAFVVCLFVVVLLRSNISGHIRMGTVHTHDNFIALPHWEPRPPASQPDIPLIHWVNQFLHYPIIAEHLTSINFKVIGLSWSALKLTRFRFSDLPNWETGAQTHSAIQSGHGIQCGYFQFYWSLWETLKPPPSTPGLSCDWCHSQL